VIGKPTCADKPFPKVYINAGSKKKKIKSTGTMDSETGEKYSGGAVTGLDNLTLTLLVKLSNSTFEP